MTDDQEPAPCPFCRSELRPVVLNYKDTDTLSWTKYQLRCPDCGYRGFTWEETE